MATANVEASTPAGTGLTIGDLIAASEVPTTESIVKSPVKKGGRGRAKKAPKTEDASLAEGAEVVDTPAEPTTPKPAAKRRRVAKTKTPATTNEDGEAQVEGAEVDATPAEPTTPKPAAKRRRVAKAKTPATINEDGEAPVEGAEVDATPAEPTTPKPAVKRRPAKAKTPATINEDGEAPATASKTTAKRGAAEVAGGETPSKKQKAAPKTPKAPKAAAAARGSFPTCWEEFSEEDKLIVTMRRDKASWTEIEDALEKTTGNKPGKDVTRKKYGKLEIVATSFAPGDSARLAAAKITVERQIVESIKQLHLAKWAKIAEEMQNIGAGVYKPAAVEKKYENMTKNDEVDESGNYVGPDQITTNGAAAEGDDEAEAAETKDDLEMTEAEVEAEAEADENA